MCPAVYFILLTNKADRWALLNPSVKPHYQHACAPHYSLYISYCTSWERLLKHQKISSVVIISLFQGLYVCSCYDTVRRK